MMFWDSSAIVPLLVPEPRSADLTAIFAQDKEPTIWWATPLECQSAIYRRHREAAALTPPVLEAARARLREVVGHVDVVAPTDEVRRRAGRLVAVHPLRAADALQLAAALVWCEEHPTGEVLVTLDTLLRDAAGREGFDLGPALML